MFCLAVLDVVNFLTPFTPILYFTQCAQGCSMSNFIVLATILTDIFNFLTLLLRHSLSDVPKMWSCAPGQRPFNGSGPDELEVGITH